MTVPVASVLVCVRQPKLAPMECLKIISIARFILPDKELKVAGGREVCLRDLQSWIFFAGADSTMIGLRNGCCLPVRRTFVCPVVVRCCRGR